MRPARRWCFTHHWKEGRTPRLLDFETQDAVSYSVYQTEICPETGKHHYQGYIHCNRPVRPTAFYQCGLSHRTHFEVCRGTPASNIDYCTKQESRIDGPWEFGTKPMGGQGSRSDILGFVTNVRNGRTDLELLESNPSEYLRYYRAVERVRLLLVPNRTDFEGVYLFVGESGTGKSYAAHQFDPDDTYFKQPGSEWFDGYTGQETIVLDEFRGWLTFATLLRLCDRYPLEVQTKGGQVKCRAKRVIITSNLYPDQWYSDKIDITPFYRRVRAWFLAKGLGKFLVINSRSEQQFPELTHNFEEWRQTYLKFNIN